jgi:hypothetical protein
MIVDGRLDVMTTAGGSPGPGVRPEQRWDVALSFAGAQRDYVERVAQALKARGVRCFYDADEEIELWGRYLAEELPVIYGEQAAAVVVFVSAEYAARDWTRHERRAALARAVRERREYVLPARFDDAPLPGLLQDMVWVDLRDRPPQQFATMVADKLAALGITKPTATASQLARGVGAASLPGAIRVSEADARRLGVHASISVPGVPDEILPEYVPRDVDDSEFGIRAKVTAAAQRGGFVVLVGGSSVGKTRSAFEAVTALLPDWWLVHPAGPAEVAALAAAPRTVVWLDELQRCLDGEKGLTGGVVRALLNAPGPVVIIGTLWPDRYTSYTTLPLPGGADLRAREREVLDLATVIRIGPEFSQAEQVRAQTAGTRDLRVRVALESAAYGLTQTLAVAPQLVARWEDAQTADPYAWAVLTAALDVTRLGARAPLSVGFLRAAAPGYCTPQQQAEAPRGWFDRALAYATSKLHGAVSALSPVGTDMGQVAGYTAADYLIQQANRQRRYGRMPVSTWDAVLSNIDDPADAARLADSAKDRLLYRYAIPLYRHAASAGVWAAALGLGWVLRIRGDLDKAEQILRGLADLGDETACCWLADMLATRGDRDEAEQILRAHTGGGINWQRAYLDTAGTAGPWANASELDWAQMQAERAAERVAGWRNPDKAEQELRSRAAANRKDAVSRLAARGDLDSLRARANDGDEYAASWLVDLLAARGDLDEAVQILRGRAQSGDGAAAKRLPVLLAEYGDLNGLRALADAGNGPASFELVNLLAGRGDLDGLRAQVSAGNWTAARLLPELLTRQGQSEEAERLRRFGLNPDGSIASA